MLSSLGSFRASSNSRFPTIDEERESGFDASLRQVPSGQEASAQLLESLEGTLYQRKQRSGVNGWKRRYVVLNISDGGSLSCYHTVGKERKELSKVHHRNSDSSERSSLYRSPVLQIPFSADWTARDIENSPSFVVEIDGSTVSSAIENDEEDNDDDVSVASSTAAASYGLQKYMAADSSSKESAILHFIFRCPRGSKEKDLWIQAFAQLRRLMSSDMSEIVEKKSTRHMFRGEKISGRARSALSSKMAKEKMQLAGQYRSSTTVALREAEEISRKVKGDEMEFKVMPSYAYPNVRFTRDELRDEMKLPSSQFHDLRVPARRGEEIGTLRVEVLQCLGLPKLDLVGETDPVVYMVCGSYAFSTDTIPDVANPSWLSKMRRACIFPLFHAYARLYVGVFDNDGKNDRDDFAGRVVVDIARLRPGCTYDVMLPLRQSAQVYSRRQRGSVRLRVHLDWVSERAALLSYLPKKIPKIQPNRSTTVRCYDETAFQNIALTVHGNHMQGHFSFKQLKATMREINFTRIVLIRLILRPQLKQIVLWENPIVSLFVFCAWMHCVYSNSVAYLPGHVLTFFLIYLWKNYARYMMDGPGHRGFLPPSWEEMLLAVMKGTPDHTPQCIAPLDMQVKNPANDSSSRSLGSLNMSQSDMLMDDEEDQSSVTSSERMPLKEIAEQFRTGVTIQTYRHRLRSYKNAFVGENAVDFLVNSNIAKSRKDAVRIGRALAREFKLFEHVRKEHKFKDERLFYRFLDVSLDKYIFTTHRPKGKSLFRMLGWYDDSYEDVINYGHLEFPFSDFVDDYPKFTVKESLVPRLSSEKKMRRMSALKSELLEEDEEEEEDVEDFESLGTGSSVLNEFIGSAKNSKKGESDMLSSVKNEDAESDDSQSVGQAGPVEQAPPSRRPPPPQDMDIIRKSDKKLTNELQKVKHRLNFILLQWFNDKVYDIKDPGATFARQSRRTEKKQKKQKEDDLATTLNRSLRCGQFSHSNRAVAKVGLFIEPIIGIALIFLSGIRALYNIFTWRDPMLSFWVSVITPLVVVVLHFFPWRIVLFLVGVILVGPQNLILRVCFGERLGKMLSSAKTKRAAKKRKEEAPKDEPFFQSNISGNSQAQYKPVDPNKVQHIVVPYSPLMYQRFYDWPPEPEYAKVQADSHESAVGMERQMLPSRSNNSMVSMPKLGSPRTESTAKLPSKQISGVFSTLRQRQRKKK